MTPARQKWELPTRAEEKAARDAADAAAGQAWRDAVWLRDGGPGCRPYVEGRCRGCGRFLSREAGQGECHHISGRIVRAIRWLRANGLLLCHACHERVTGTVGRRDEVVCAETFTAGGRYWPSGDGPVVLRRVT